MIELATFDNPPPVGVVFGAYTNKNQVFVCDSMERLESFRDSLKEGEEFVGWRYVAKSKNPPPFMPPIPPPKKPQLQVLNREEVNDDSE